MSDRTAVIEECIAAIEAERQINPLRDWDGMKAAEYVLAQMRDAVGPVCRCGHGPEVHMLWVGVCQCCSDCPKFVALSPESRPTEESVWREVVCTMCEGNGHHGVGHGENAGQDWCETCGGCGRWRECRYCSEERLPDAAAESRPTPGSELADISKERREAVIAYVRVVRENAELKEENQRLRVDLSIAQNVPMEQAPQPMDTLPSDYWTERTTLLLVQALQHDLLSYIFGYWNGRHWQDLGGNRIHPLYWATLPQLPDLAAPASVGAGTLPQKEPPEDRCPTCEGAGVVDMEQLHCELVSSAPVARQLERICEVLSAHIGSDNVHRILQSAEAPTHEPLRCVCGHAATRHRVHSGQNTGRCTEEPHCDCEQFAAAPVPPRGAEPQEDAGNPKFTQSFDGFDWAKAFVQHVTDNPAIASDVETMHTWFANAIMRGWDEHARRYPEAAAAPLGATEPPASEGTALQARLRKRIALLEAWRKSSVNAPDLNAEIEAEYRDAIAALAHAGPTSPYVGPRFATVCVGCPAPELCKLEAKCLGHQPAETPRQGEPR